MNRRLHVGLLTPMFTGLTGVDSGIGVHFRHLADGLAASGTDVSVILVTDKQIPMPPERPYGLRLVTCRPPTIARFAGKISWQLHQYLTLRAGIRAATRSLRTLPVDIWETTNTGSLARDFLSRSNRAPVVVRVSTTAGQLRMSNAGVTHWISRRLEAWEQATVLRADHVLTHSATHRAALVKQYGLKPERIQIIPHGIPMPPVPARHPVADRCRLLYVGRLEHRKGIDLLITALPAVLRAAPHVECMLVGADRESHWAGQWRQMAPPELREQVHFAGVLSPAALNTCYREADLFVAPSRYESFGLIFVEAMASALPVVAMRTPGAVDLIEDNVTGVLTPPEDTAALAEALIRLATDPGRRERLGAAARRVAEEHYSVDALVSASLAYYRKCISSLEP